MLFKAVIISFVAALSAAGGYVCAKYGFASVRKKLRAFSSRLLVALAAFGALLLAAVCCCDCVSPLLKDALAPDAVDGLRGTLKLFFGTTSVMASVKTLFVSCVMLGVLCCVSFGFGGFGVAPRVIAAVGFSSAEGGERYEGADGVFGKPKFFLSYSAYIS